MQVFTKAKPFQPISNTGQKKSIVDYTGKQKQEEAAFFINLLYKGGSNLKHFQNNLKQYSLSIAEAYHLLPSQVDQVIDNILNSNPYAAGSEDKKINIVKLSA